MYEQELSEISQRANGNKQQAREEMEEFLAGEGLDKPRRIEVILDFIVGDIPKEEAKVSYADKLKDLIEEEATLKYKLTLLAEKMQPGRVEKFCSDLEKTIAQHKMLLKLGEMALEKR